MKILDKLKELKICEKNLAASDRFHRVAKKEFRRERQVLPCLWKKNIDPMWFWGKSAYFWNSIFFFFRFSKVHWWLRLRLVSAPSLFHFHLHLKPKFVWSFYNNCGNISVCGGGLLICIWKEPEFSFAIFTDIERMLFQLCKIVPRETNFEKWKKE